jgi:hypothetical protein
MKDTTKRYLLIGGSLLVVAGVIYYFYKRNKVSTTSYDDDSSEETNVTNPSATTPTATPTKPGISIPKELNTIAKVKAFQDWMDAKGLGWVKGADGKYYTNGQPNLLKKGVGYGIFGPSTSDVWKAYKGEYLKTLGGTQTVAKTGNANLDKVLSRFAGSMLTKGTDGKYKVEVYFNSYQYKATFYENGVFGVEKLDKLPSNAGYIAPFIASGNYYDGGRKLVVTTGSRAGQTISTDNAWTSIRSLV